LDSSPSPSTTRSFSSSTQNVPTNGKSNASEAAINTDIHCTNCNQRIPLERWPTHSSSCQALQSTQESYSASQPSFNKYGKALLCTNLPKGTWFGSFSWLSTSTEN
jgi:hypothetical protein